MEPSLRDKCHHLRAAAAPDGHGIFPAGGGTARKTEYRIAFDIFRNRTNRPVFSIFGSFGGFCLRIGSAGIALWTVPATEPEEAETQPVFCAADAEEIKFKNGSGLRYDKGALIEQPLHWDLTAAEPTVLILHTHTTESYTKVKGETYEETAAFRTLDEAYNMVSVGDHLAQLLTDGGVTVIHDRELHDYPSYNGSYNHARKAMERNLKENPSICLVLDLHRDASGDVQNQMRTKATVDGAAAAQIMFVVGTNGTGLKHPDWKENLALALKLQVQRERRAPGICRKLNLRGQRINQEQSPGALLVEVGAAGNTREDALRAVEVLARAILDLSHGTAAE